MQDFAHITSSPTLEKISKETLRSLISSDFVQVSSFSRILFSCVIRCEYVGPEEKNFESGIDFNNYRTT
jgi:hypothetical protein